MGNIHGHSHQKQNMMLAHAGNHHALLTSHLSSKDGNELDVFFESADHHNPQPMALSTALVITLSGTIIHKNGTKNAITFDCAPLEERPKGETDQACSHFVAKVPFVLPNEIVDVSITIPMKDSNPLIIEWKNFDVKKFCHHQD